MIVGQDTVAKPVNHFVVPVGTIKLVDYKDDDGNLNQEYVYESFGTAFFVGGNSHLITAGHVVDQMIIDGGDMIFLMQISGQWHYFAITQHEKHPVEDVAVMKVAPGKWFSIMELSKSSEYQTCPYTLWGYPEHVSLELANFSSPSKSGAPLEKPELIASMGHIRRRLSRAFPLAIFTGQNFYELSELGGSKCSGAPIVKTRTGAWQVIGIYIGENTGSWQFAVGYATRTDSLIGWAPALLGHDIFHEKATHP